MAKIDSEPQVDFRATKHGIVVGIPSALIVAVVTALSTGAVVRYSIPEREPVREHLDDATIATLRKELGEIKVTQTQILEKLNQVEQDSKNRDAIQEASIAALRNR